VASLPDASQGTPDSRVGEERELVDSDNEEEDAQQDNAAITIAGLYHIVELDTESSGSASNSNSEDEKTAEEIAIKKKKAQTLRTRRTRKRTFFTKPLETLTSSTFLCYVDDTAAAKKKTVICVDPDPDHLPEEHPTKHCTSHFVYLSQLWFTFAERDFRSRYCIIEYADILTLEGAERFLDNHGWASMTVKEIRERCQNLVPIYPAEPDIVPRIEHVREQAFQGATCHCWNQYVFPYLFTMIKKTGEQHKLDVTGMRARSVKLSNVNAVYQSKHRAVREAWNMLLGNITMNVVCHTANMTCMGSGQNEESLYNSLVHLKENRVYTYPPLKFLKASHSRSITFSAFKNNSPLLMDHKCIAGPTYSDESVETFKLLTWDELFTDAKNRLVAIHTQETDLSKQNRLLTKANIMANGIVCKAHGDSSGDLHVHMRPRGRNETEMTVEVRLLKTAERITQTPGEFFEDEESFYVEVYCNEAATTGMDIYAYYEKNYVYQIGYLKVRKTPGRPGTRGVECVEMHAVLPEVPWKKTPRNDRISNSKYIKESMSSNIYDVGPKSNLPFVSHFYKVPREGTAKVPTMLSLHPFPGPGVRSMGGYPTHAFVRDMTRRMGTYMVQNMAKDGSIWY